MRGFRVVLISALAAAAVHAGVAQQQPPTFRSRVDLVELDVSVLDASHRPIRGLTRGDFTVLEDGKPQEIAIFTPVEVPGAAEPSAPWIRDVTPDVDTNTAKVTRLWTIVLDDALIPTDGYAIKTSLDVARQAISLIGPQDLAALVFTADSRRAQDFTNDRSKLLAALEQFNPGWASWTEPPKNVRINTDSQFHIGSVRTLRNVLDTLTEVPHHRKSIVWISPGFGLPMFSSDQFSITDALADVRALEIGLEVLEMAKVGNVPIYGVSPCGLVSIDMARQPGASRCTVAAAAGGPQLWALSSSSGGRPLGNTNSDLSAEIDSIFDENSSYYQIGYYPTNTRLDGRVRAVDVKVGRPAVVVRSRRNYVAPKKAPAPPKNVGEALGLTIAEPIPVAGMPMRATAAAFANPANLKQATVAIALGMNEVVPPRAGVERVEVTTHMSIGAYTTEGDKKATHRSTARVLLRPGAEGDAEYEALARITLPPGRVRLRVAAHNGAAAKAGSVTVDVDVPNFGTEPFSLSGVVVGASPGLPSAPRDLFAPALPVVPTAQRDFKSGDRVTTYFEAYHRAAPVADAVLTARIVDAADHVVLTDTRTIAAASFVPAKLLSVAQIKFDVPLQRLTPGRYLLTFEMKVQDRLLRRDVQFRVLESKSP
jgi:VWFA-related protein